MFQACGGCSHFNQLNPSSAIAKGAPQRVPRARNAQKGVKESLVYNDRVTDGNKTTTASYEYTVNHLGDSFSSLSHSSTVRDGG